jgi:hypothetical protein
MTGLSFGPSNPTFRQVDDETRLRFLASVVDKVRNIETSVDDVD